MNLINKLPKITLWILLAASVAVIVLFAFDGNLNDMDVFTNVDTMLGWGGFLLFAAILITLVSLFILFANDFRTDPKQAIKSLVTIICFVAVLVLTWVFGGEAVRVFGVEASVADFKLTDMCIYTSALLLTIAILSILISGVVKMFNR